MFRTIRSKLFFSFGILGSVTALVGIALIILFDNYVSENKILLDNIFPQVIRASEFKVATNKLVNTGSLMISAANKNELTISYKRINQDLNAFRKLTTHISKDHLFNNQIRFIQLADELGNALDMSLLLHVQIFELYNKMDAFYDQNNKYLKELWDSSARNKNVSLAKKIRVVQAMLMKLTAIQGERHRALENVKGTTENMDTTPKFQEELITAALKEQLHNTLDDTGKLNFIDSAYLKNYRGYLKTLEQFTKKRSFMETNSNELRTLENELMSLASNYQEVVSKHFQKSRNDLNKQVEQNSIIVLSVVVISILFVALVIWLVSSRGIVSRLNYLMDAILSGSKEIIDNNKSDDEIGKLSDAIRTLMTGQRHLEFRNKTLEVIAESKDLKAILKQIILFYESENLDSICSVLLLDEERKHLTHGVAPSLPSFYSSGIDGLVIGPNAGPCGAAAYKNELTLVENISTNPLCENFKELANRAGLKACWSQPILSSKGEVLGTFAVYYKTAKSPGEEELKLLKTLAYKAGFAIEANYQEKALKNHTEALKQSNQELQNFASIASHDLKEPLRKIVAFSELLVERETNLSDSSRNYLERIQKSSLRMANFIDNLLKYSKVSIHKELAAPLDLNEVLTQVTNDLESQIASTHAQINIAEMPRLNMSFHHAQQLFQNLISNALKFHKKDVPPIIHITSFFNSNEKAWEIRVEDNGIGFEEKDANQIFKMFERLQGRSAYEGTGIGLAICEKIVKLYAGEITTESKQSEGATFIIKLPEVLNS